MCARPTPFGRRRPARTPPAMLTRPAIITLTDAHASTRAELPVAVHAVPARGRALRLGVERQALRRDRPRHGAAPAVRAGMDDRIRGGRPTAQAARKLPQALHARGQPAEAGALCLLGRRLSHPTVARRELHRATPSRGLHARAGPRPAPGLAALRTSENASGRVRGRCGSVCGPRLRWRWRTACEETER